MARKHQLFVRCICSYTDGRMQEAIAHTSNIKSPLKVVIGFINDSASTILYGNNSCLAIKTTFEVAVTDPAVQQVLKDRHYSGSDSYALFSGILYR